MGKEIVILNEQRMSGGTRYVYGALIPAKPRVGAGGEVVPWTPTANIPPFYLEHLSTIEQEAIDAGTLIFETFDMTLPEGHSVAEMRTAVQRKFAVAKIVIPKRYEKPAEVSYVGNRFDGEAGR